MIDSKKFAAFGAVFVMIAVAFAGISFVSEEADALDYGTNVSPLTSLDVFCPSGEYFVLQGSYIRLSYDQAVEGDEFDHILAVDSGLNLDHDPSNCEYTGYANTPGSFTVKSGHLGSAWNDDSEQYEDEVLDEWTATIHVVKINGSSTAPLYSIDYTLVEGGTDAYTVWYVAVGSTVSFTGYLDEGGTGEYGSEVRSVTSGFGLNSTGCGTITKSGTITLTCHWWNGSKGADFTMTVIAVDVNHNHTITYSGNGNTGGSTANTVVSVSGTNAANVTLASNGYTKTGYTFTGWLVNGTVYQPGATISVAADATVTATAQWSQNTVSATASTLYGKTDASYTHQISASANNGGSITSYAIKSATGVTASVSASGLVTYNCPAVTSTTTYSLTVTVTGTFSDGSTISKDVTFDVLVDPVLDFTNSVTDGFLDVKGA